MWTAIRIFLVCGLVKTQAANTEDFFGEWTQVAFYPVSVYAPMCITYAFAKDPDNVPCSCDDGKNATLTEFSLLSYGQKLAMDKQPMLAVDTISEINFNVPCTCGSAKYKSRVIVRNINSNFIVMYHEPKGQPTKEVPNSAYIYARKIPSSSDLWATIQNIEDLKNRRGAEMCVKETSKFNEN